MSRKSVLLHLGGGQGGEHSKSICSQKLPSRTIEHSRHMDRWPFHASLCALTGQFYSWRQNSVQTLPHKNLNWSPPMCIHFERNHSRVLKICSTCQISMDYRNTKKKKKKNLLKHAVWAEQHNCCSWIVQLLQLAFHREGDPNFPWEKSQWDNKVVK